MKLLLRRDQRSSLMGKAVFVLDVRAELSAEERRSISTYKFGKAVLYSKQELVDRGSGLLGLASRLAFHAANISVTVDDLAHEPGVVDSTGDHVRRLSGDPVVGFLVSGSRTRGRRLHRPADLQRA